MTWGKGRVGKDPGERTSGPTTVSGRTSPRDPENLPGTHVPDNSITVLRDGVRTDVFLLSLHSSTSCTPLLSHSISTPGWFPEP